jgi:hypothetical protein
LKSYLPFNNVKTINFLFFDKDSYDKFKINTIIMFPPLNNLVWCKSILHAYNNLMKNNDVLICLVPYCIYDDITNTRIPSNANNIEYIDLFNNILKCFDNENVSWKISKDSYLPDFQLYYDTVILHLQKN